MDILVCRECPDPTVLLVTAALLVWLVLLVQEAQLVLMAPLVRTVQMACLVLLDPLDTVVLLDMLDLLVLLDLLVIPDPLVQLVVDMTHLEDMMSTELIRPLSGLRIMRWMQPSSP